MKNGDFMKVFVCTGASLDRDSTTDFVVQRYLRYLEKYTNKELDVYYANLINHNVAYCNGSLEPFITGKTQEDDDMLILEKEILRSDLIIIASPVYANNVSGSIKNFIDRIAHWTHLFRLVGKYGVVFSVTSNSGGNDVADYLENILSSMGVSVICKDIFVTSLVNREVIDNILQVDVKFSVQEISDNKYKFTNDQEKNFKKYQTLYKKGIGFLNELEFWEKNGLFKVRSLSDYANKETLKNDD